MAGNTIILMEDDTHLLKLYKIVLEEQGYEVICFENSKGIAGHLKTYSPALIITDLVMPNYDGMDAIFKVLANYSIPIIVISAYLKYLQLIEEEVTLALYKPIDTQVLVKAVKQLIPIE